MKPNPSWRWCRTVTCALFFLGFVPLASQADDVPVAPLQERTALELARNATLQDDFPRARAELSRISSFQAQHPYAFFLGACIALEDGEWQRALEATRALKGAIPDNPEADVLNALIRVRRDQPELPWVDAYVRAWNEAGRPDLSSSSFLAVSDTDLVMVPDVRALWEQPLDPESRLVLAWDLYPDEEPLRYILSRIPTLEDPSWAMALFAQAIRSQVPEATREVLHEALRQRWDAWLDEFPDAMDLRLVALLMGTPRDKPLSGEDFLELEQLSQLPEWRSARFAEFWERTHQHWRAMGYTGLDAWGRTESILSSTLGWQVANALEDRAKASLKVYPAAAKKKLGEVLWRVGSRLAVEPQALDYFIGTRMMLEGAEALEDPERLSEALELHEEGTAAFLAWQRAAGESWPLPSLRRAFLHYIAHDEMSAMRKHLPVP